MFALTFVLMLFLAYGFIQTGDTLWVVCIILTLIYQRLDDISKYIEEDHEDKEEE